MTTEQTYCHNLCVLSASFLLPMAEQIDSWYAPQPRTILTDTLRCEHRLCRWPSEPASIGIVISKHEVRSFCHTVDVITQRHKDFQYDLEGIDISLIEVSDGTETVAAILREIAQCMIQV